MNGNNSDRPRRSVRATGPGIAIALTAIVCATALLFRTPLRSRYWAWRITQTDVVAERAVYLTALCNVGDAGRWGTRVLLAHEVAELRQHGVVVLQHVRTAWSRRKLLQMLRDRDQTVRELAALGLALHGDAAVIPDLCEMFVTGDDTAASAACVALERLGTPAVIASLGELVAQPTTPFRRACLIDALADIGSAECVPPLLALLVDHHPCVALSRSARFAQRVLAEFPGLVSDPTPTSSPTTTSALAPATVAERAAAALAQITGVDEPFSSDASPAQQQHAAQRWADWHAAQTERP